jgi:hypothetical protein
MWGQPPSAVHGAKLRLSVASGATRESNTVTEIRFTEYHVCGTFPVFGPD